MLPEERLRERLCKMGLTLAVAESCTGGLVADRVTDVPGCSDYFLAGIVSYSNDSKMRLLGVSKSSLIAHGAVSEEVAREMAEGVRERVGATVGLSTTGIAGPGGGTIEKPVGLVYMAFADPRQTVVRRRVFKGDRREIKEAAATYLLEMTLSLIGGVSTRD